MNVASRETIRARGCIHNSDAAHYFGALAADYTDLLRHAAGGNAAAFEAIAAGYDHAILRLLLALTLSEPAALDLCHATLMAAYRQLPQRRADSVYIWLFRLAAKEWLAWATDPRQSQSRDAERVAGLGVRNAIGQLSARERLVFTLKTNQHMALHTVAQIVGVSEETARRIFSRAVSRLRLSMPSCHTDL